MANHLYNSLKVVKFSNAASHKYNCAQTNQELLLRKNDGFKDSNSSSCQYSLALQEGYSCRCWRRREVKFLNHLQAE